MIGTICVKRKLMGIKWGFGLRRQNPRGERFTKGTSKSNIMRKRALKLRGASGN